MEMTEEQRETVKGAVIGALKGLNKEQAYRKGQNQLDSLTELTAKKDLMQVTVKAITDNPKLNNPTYEFEKTEAYIKANQKVQLIEMNNRLYEISYAIEEAVIEKGIIAEYLNETFGDN